MRYIFFEVPVFIDRKHISITAFSAAELKDLFTVQTKTNGCLTRQFPVVRPLNRSLIHLIHSDDLLECECLQEQVKKYNLDEDSKTPSEASDEEDLPDLSDLTSSKNANTVDDDDSTDDEDEEPAFVSASQYDGKGVSFPKDGRRLQPVLSKICHKRRKSKRQK